MNGRTMNSAPFLALVGLAVLLGGVLFLELAGPAAPAALHRGALLAAAPATGASGPAAAPGNVPRLVDAILGRPLFEASRRPTSSAPAAAGSAAVASLPRLAGIIISPTRRFVIFASAANGKPLVLAEGDKVDGYLIESIGPDQVIIRTRDGSHVLHPTFDLNAPKTSPPRPAPYAANAAAALLAVPAASPASDAPPLMPGLRGRPLGLAASAGDTAQPATSFPSLAAPAPQTLAPDHR